MNTLLDVTVVEEWAYYDGVREGLCTVGDDPTVYWFYTSDCEEDVWTYIVHPLTDEERASNLESRRPSLPAIGTFTEYEFASRSGE